LKSQHQQTVGQVSTFERRHDPRFRIEVEVTVNSKTCGVVKGHTADISPSGISAILAREIPVGELVELEFTLPYGDVRIYAVVRQRSAFRYGFRFAESNFISEVIEPTCRHLKMEQYVKGEC
jgi:hypothetical protein